jgi:hypothetical protein
MIQPRRPLWTGPLAIGLVLAGVFGTGLGLGLSSGLPWPHFGHRAAPLSTALEPSRPVRIEIPALKVRAPVRPVGLAPDGTIAVPPLDKHNEAGWFDRGPTPGQSGPAVIVGHADTRTGPSIFHDVATLPAGSRIEVTRQDGTVAVFAVDSVEHFDKGKLPADRVYGDFSAPSLRLVTCGGQWLGGSVGYRDNIVVFASLADAHRA